jgi:glucosamine-6-phosphate deaminase
MNQSTFIFRRGTGRGAKIPLKKLGESGEDFTSWRWKWFQEIEKNNALGRRTVFICPVGRWGSTPSSSALSGSRRLPLNNCWYHQHGRISDGSGAWIDENSPLSFRGFMNREGTARLTRST